ncbi:MAG: hypothetical protein D6702_06170 [Planctomycetota bacterium]|nr:MAG: hypothetical protein D6702_06170 [Planctomycetota bacterium]
MNLIRWTASALLTTFVIPPLLGIGGDAQAAPMSPALQQEIARLAAQPGGQGVKVEDGRASFLILATDEVMEFVADGLEGIEPYIEIVQQVKEAAAGPSMLPPGIRLARVSFELALPAAAAAHP